MKLPKSIDCVPLQIPNPVRVDIKNISELLIYALENNYHLTDGLFYKIFSAEHEKVKTLKKTKIAKFRKLFDLLYERQGEITDINERCLFKCFLSFLLKGKIWELEFRKLSTSAEHIGEEKLHRSVYDPLEFFFVFFDNYNPKNSKDLIGISFSNIEKVLDADISNDYLYYTLITKNKTSLDAKLCLSYYSFLYDDKEYLAASMQKTVKSLTSMTNTLCGETGLLDLEKILHEREIEKNHILYDDVDLSVIQNLMNVFIARTDLKKIPPYEPEYKKAKRSIKRKFPNFAFT